MLKTKKQEDLILRQVALKNIGIYKCLSLYPNNATTGSGSGNYFL